MREGFPDPTVKGRRNDFTDESASVNGPLSSTKAIPQATFPQSISSALRRLQVERGGKDLASCFDGREGKEVAESTLSRWIADPSRFPAILLPVLVELDGPFRSLIFGMLAARSATPEAVMQRLSPEAADEVGRAYQGIILEEAAGGPGRWVRR